MTNAAKYLVKLTGARAKRDDSAVTASKAAGAEDFEGLEDDSWFDEELSDEELAALGEEAFDDLDDLDDLEDLDDLGDDFPSDDLDLAEDEAASADRADALAIRDDEDPYSHAMANMIERGASANADRSPVPSASEAATEFDTLRATAAANVSRSTATVVAPNHGIEEIVSSDADHLPVPRISIHAFCESDETTALLEQAAIDRRLSKTHLTMHMGGIPKAVDHFQTNVTPNLIILETLSGGQELLSLLGQLAEVCDPSTKVIVIGCVNDITLYRELIRTGISEYIVNPHSPLQIIRAVSSLYVDPSAPPIGKTLAFVGARGGVGSSTIAHNVGWCAAERLESDTVILDLDLPFGTASLDFEQDPTSGLLEALASPERLDAVLLDRLLQKHTDRLSLFTAPNLLDRDYELSDQAFETVVDVVRSAAPTIVVDIPHVWTAWSKRLLQTADEIIITTTPDLAAFRNTKNLVDVISSARPNDGAPKLVINQYDAKNSSVQPEQYAEHVGLDPICVVNWEPQLFHTAATNAAPIQEVGPKTKAAQGLSHLTQVLLGRTETLQKRSGFDFAKLFKR
ncbi:MAG: pilus assembly protein CpaE [Alphaproteobacteria bacterium]|nr:pilus assembly protein CpaE [Alphaproteobacteria bacterium]